MIKSWRGVLRALRVHGAVQGGAPTFFWAPGVPLGAAKVRTMTKLEVNPALNLKVLFSSFEFFGASQEPSELMFGGQRGPKDPS